mmetsp:Transcript_9214/g.25777  ORF Transcript_9214/g.25777 Transcript_9214/m.25777 type:complete len:323 (+) Transcript_9214:52-1020(+)
MAVTSNNVVDNAPRASYAVTVVVALLLLVGACSAFLVQLLAALFTWPLFLCSNGRDRFHGIQSRILRFFLSFFCVALNPFWCQSTHSVGPAAGPPDMVPGSILFCNHRSNADPFMVSWLLVAMCIEARFVYKSSLGKLPILGWCSIMAGDLAVRFGDKQQIQLTLNRTREVLRQGYHVVVFPEGTRSPSGLLQDFKPSFFEICAELDCPAVPVCLLGTERAWPLGGVRMGCAPVHLAVGEPVMPGPGGAKALSAEVASQMQDMAREVLVERAEDADAADDPFISGRPYAYWRPPKELDNLGEDERLLLLKSGKAHERGAHLF